MTEDNAITYFRKSISPKGMELDEAIGYQELVIKEYAANHNMVITASFSDIGYTGKTLERPELTEMREYLDNNEVDVLLIYTIDRLGRDLRNNINLMLEIVSKVKRVIFVADNTSTDNYQSFKLQFLVKTAIAQEERETLLNRFSSGRRSKVLRQQYFNGNKAPIGYVINPKTKWLEPATPHNSSDIKQIIGLTIVRYIFLSYLFGMSTRQIAKSVNKHFGNAPRRGDWDNKAISYVLRNPAYIGKLEGEFEEKESYSIDGNIVPIVDKGFFLLIQNKLDNEKPGRKKKVRTPFTHLTLCLQCLNQLVHENDLLICKHCLQTVEADVISYEVERTVELFICDKENQNLVEEQLESKKTELFWKRRDLENSIEKLMERRRDIDSELDTDMRDFMVSANTEKMVLLKNNLTETNSILEYLESRNQKEFLVNNSFLDTTLCLPFIVFIDLHEQQIQISFHEKIFLNCC